MTSVQSRVVANLLYNESLFFSFLLYVTMLDIFISLYKLIYVSLYISFIYTNHQKKSTIRLSDNNMKH
jgi:hypothetical protein